MNIEYIARVVHEVNRAYCAALGDDSQPPWEDIPEWMRESVGNGVFFHLENPNATPAESHENWLTVKERQGWKYGPVKDEVKKEHPCMVPFVQLPITQKAKDYIFKALVDNLSKD